MSRATFRQWRQICASRRGASVPEGRGYWQCSLRSSLQFVEFSSATPSSFKQEVNTIPSSSSVSRTRDAAEVAFIVSKFFCLHENEYNGVSLVVVVRWSALVKKIYVGRMSHIVNVSDRRWFLKVM